MWMMPTAEPGEPLWWLHRLHREIIDRAAKLDRLQAYYDGEHRLAFASRRFKEAFGDLFEAFADNWCEVVVDAAEERLNVQGFRVSPTDTAEDDGARAIWQHNELDAQSQLVHNQALIDGEAYGLVWFGDDAMPEITVEHAASCAVARHPKMRRRRRAGVRLWRDEWGYEHAELFLPDAVHFYRRKADSQSIIAEETSRLSWQVDSTTDEDLDDAGDRPNPLGVVPLVPFCNRPRLRRRGRGVWVGSELKAVIPLQDGVNKMIADMMVASELVAGPSRAIIGWEPETDEVTNQPKDPPFRPWDRVITLEDPDGKVVQLPAGDLGNFVGAVEMLVQHVASISRTPPHYLNASADRLSGESIKAAETGLVAKVRRKQRYFGEAWEEIMRLAGRVAELPDLAAATEMETIWADPESRTEAEHVDAVGKKRQMLSVPLEQAWEDAGYSPQQIGRMRSAAAGEQLLIAEEPGSAGAGT